MTSERHRLIALVSLLAAALAGCAHGVRRFPLAAPMSVDEGDFRVYGPRPEEYYSPFAWDGADQMLFRPISRFFAVDVRREAVDVNAMDEVPDSSWFHNRLGRPDEYAMRPETFARAACEGETLDENSAPGAWQVVAAKPNGANPGFIIEAPTGTRYLLKFDSLDEPERATTADVLGSILYWAAGFHTPCNRIIYFEPSILSIREGATAEIGGEDVPMTMEMLLPALERAPRDAEGRLRASASRFLPGRPIGPWRYEGTRDDDPNDVVDHQERRELRGAFVLAGWLNHFDSREQNTLAIWRSEEGSGDRGYVEHYYIDWGDCLGSQWSINGISRRLGYSSYFDFRHFLEDFVTLGTIPRRWHHAEVGHDIWGYFRGDDFVPDRYRPGYPNPAFNRATERDNAWMTRIVARMRPELIDAALDATRMQNTEARAALREILLARRDLILNRWLTRLSPLAHPTLSRSAAGGARLCATDLAVASGIVAFDARPYWTRAYVHDAASDDVELLDRPSMVRHAPDQVCATLPSVRASAEEPAYLIVDIAAADRDESGRPEDDAPPLRVHLYQLDAETYRIVGVERPDHTRAPSGRE